MIFIQSEVHIGDVYSDNDGTQYRIDVIEIQCISDDESENGVRVEARLKGDSIDTNDNTESFDILYTKIKDFRLIRRKEKYRNGVFEIQD